MNITLYNPEMRERCIEIFKSNQPKYFAEEELRLFMDFLDDDIDNNYYVIEKDGEIQGCGGVFLDQRSGEVGLSWGMVHASCHKQGFGKALTIFRLELMKQQFPGAVYKVDTSQYTAAFYEKSGFSILEIIPDGFAPGLDKYIMKMKSSGSKP